MGANPQFSFISFFILPHALIIQKFHLHFHLYVPPPSLFSMKYYPVHIVRVVNSKMVNLLTICMASLRCIAILDSGTRDFLQSVCISTLWMLLPKTLIIANLKSGTKLSAIAGGTLWCDMMNQGGVSDTRTTLDQKVSLEVFDK
ncbi:hypothetical protein HanHA300_Chr12g0437161 [Helianthus annuus]|nr:hypothetical protein HanHA300_Chr12g0437161 [Helianthus annuus]KAJ0504671.1 hypothetical protein HanHA89_Chr12g0461851 [Helianthus annuus]KAJ0674400.1 hypothetical protein HanLR1_Chr12g0439501 [Helianthus annuus]KAJ0862068.1 hypothetical protein HanPSC8_Chr12g0513841 [Helianthus annuus]